MAEQFPLSSLCNRVPEDWFAVRMYNTWIPYKANELQSLARHSDPSSRRRLRVCTWNPHNTAGPFALNILDMRVYTRRCFLSALSSPLHFPLRVRVQYVVPNITTSITLEVNTSVLCNPQYANVCFGFFEAIAILQSTLRSCDAAQMAMFHARFRLEWFAEACSLWHNNQQLDDVPLTLTKQQQEEVQWMSRREAEVRSVKHKRHAPPATAFLCVPLTQSSGVISTNCGLVPFGEHGVRVPAFTGAIMANGARTGKCVCVIETVRRHNQMNPRPSRSSLAAYGARCAKGTIVVMNRIRISYWKGLIAQWYPEASVIVLDVMKAFRPYRVRDLVAVDFVLVSYHMLTNVQIREFVEAEYSKILRHTNYTDRSSVWHGYYATRAAEMLIHTRGDTWSRQSSMWLNTLHWNRIVYDRAHTLTREFVNKLSGDMVWGISSSPGRIASNVLYYITTQMMTLSHHWAYRLLFSQVRAHIGASSLTPICLHEHCLYSPVTTDVPGFTVPTKNKMEILARWLPDDELVLKERGGDYATDQYVMQSNARITVRHCDSTTKFIEQAQAHLDENGEGHRVRFLRSILGVSTDDDESESDEEKSEECDELSTIECPVCRDNKIDSILACGHQFCNKCLLNVCSSGVVQCAMCRFAPAEQASGAIWSWPVGRNYKWMKKTLTDSDHDRYQRQLLPWVRRKLIGNAVLLVICDHELLLRRLARRMRRDLNDTSVLLILSAERRSQEAYGKLGQIRRVNITGNESPPRRGTVALISARMIPFLHLPVCPFAHVHCGHIFAANTLCDSVIDTMLTGGDWCKWSLEVKPRDFRMEHFILYA